MLRQYQKNNNTIQRQFKVSYFLIFLMKTACEMPELANTIVQIDFDPNYIDESEQFQTNTSNKNQKDPKGKGSQIPCADALIENCAVVIVIQNAGIAVFAVRRQRGSEDGAGVAGT